MAIHPGTAIDLVCHVVILATGLDKTSGTIYAYVRRSSDSYWLKADASWAATKPTGGDLPTATAIAQGLWKLNVSGTVTGSLTAGDSVVCRMTDNETEASATVTSDVVEHSVIPAAAPTAAAVADAVWDEATSGHTTAGTAGKMLTDIDTSSTANNTSQGTQTNHLKAIARATVAQQNIAASDGTFNLYTYARGTPTTSVIELEAYDSGQLRTGTDAYKGMLLYCAQNGTAAFGQYRKISASAENGTRPGNVDVTLEEALDTAPGEYDDVFMLLAAPAASTSAPTAAQVADAVWTEAIADHSGTAGSTAEALANVTASVPGVGEVALNHDYGGADALAYLDSDSNPIAGATVRVFTAAQWAAGTLGSPSGITTTDNNGRWLEPVYVPAGSYVVHFELPYQYGPDVQAVTVT